MVNIPIPYDRLAFFLKELDIIDEELRVFAPYRDLFVGRKDAFGDFMYNYFYSIPRTRIILDHDKPPKRLAKTLASWFETLFKSALDEDFLGYLWRSGLRHVEVNLDQRYVNLGYSTVWQFCHRIIATEIGLEVRQKIAATVDKMLDLCVLVTTDAYLTAITRCDLEVIKGVAHQVRNPITVIGGNIRRLQRKVEANCKDDAIFHSIIQESMRLERMVADIGVYNDILRVGPKFAVTAVKDVLQSAVKELKTSKSMQNVPVEIAIDPRHGIVKADAHDLEIMFRYLLENSFEAVEPENPHIRISSSADSNKGFIHVEIFNNGTPLAIEDLENIYTPFYSSKATGTGFGLPIARMIARKNLGSITLEPVPGEGTKCLVILPKAEAI